jgi:hypothetical protein
VADNKNEPDEVFQHKGLQIIASTLGGKAGDVVKEKQKRKKTLESHTAELQKILGMNREEKK